MINNPDLRSAGAAFRKAGQNVQQVLTLRRNCRVQYSTYYLKARDV
jgi:hypothetical protein